MGLEQLLQRPQNVRTEPTSLNGVAKMSERSCTRVLPTEPSESGTAQRSACTKQPHLVRWRMHIRCRLSDFGAQPVGGGGGMLQLHGSIEQATVRLQCGGRKLWLQRFRLDRLETTTPGRSSAQ